MKLLTKVHLLYCSCYVKQQYVDDDDNESLSLCVNTSRSKIPPVVNDCSVPPSWRMAVEEEKKSCFQAAQVDPSPFPARPPRLRDTGAGGTGLLMGFKARSAPRENRARPPSTSMRKRNVSCSTCGSRTRSRRREGSKAIKCKARAEQSKCLSASARDTRVSANRERKLKAVSTYCKAL